MPLRPHHLLPPLLLLTFILLPPILASSGDRNPTYQHCLRGCKLTYCDPSQPPIPFYLRAFGWDCVENCRYDCSQSFTDNIRAGGRWHQFYGKWPFYRLGPFQEPFSVLMSIGNLYVNLRGITEVRRRVRLANKLRRWLEVMGWVQVNTWVWSTVFHSRDTSVTERLDYFAATLTISFSLLYSLLRIFSLQTPLGTSRLAFPIAGLVACLVLAHFTYLLSFPPGSFPYGYHSAFNLCLAIGHNLLWIIWSASFYLPLPSFNLGNYSLGLPYPYPPNNPLTTARPKDAATPISLVALTTLAMSFELLDFAPLFRMMDAHSLWHASTIPLAIAWWTFLCSDAVEVEGTMLGARGVSSVGVGVDEKMPLSGGSQTPGTPSYAQLAAGVGVQKGRSKSPGRSPGRGEKGERVD